MKEIRCNFLKNRLPERSTFTNKNANSENVKSALKIRLEKMKVSFWTSDISIVMLLWR